MSEATNSQEQPQKSGESQAAGVLMLVLGCLVLVVVGGFALLMAGLSQMGGTTDSEYEAAAYEGAKNAFEEIDRSHFETVEILQGFESHVVLLPTEESWKNREELYAELEEISKIPQVSEIELIIRDHPEKSVITEQSVFAEDPSGTSAEVWKNLVTLAERSEAHHARYDSFGYWLDGDPIESDEIKAK